MVCGRSGGTTIAVITAGALLVLLLGVLATWSRRGAPGSDLAASNAIAAPRRLLANVGLLAAALFLLAIVLQASAALFLPNCVG